MLSFFEASQMLQQYAQYLCSAQYFQADTNVKRHKTLTFGGFLDDWQ